MDRNPAYRNLLTRRSCRAYEKDQLSLEQLELLCQAGQYAPTGKGSQALAFLAVEKEDLVRQLSDLNKKVMQQINPSYDADPFYGAPAVIAVFAKSGPNAQKDGSAAIENILLAAHALSLGSCWINRALEVFQMPEGRAIASAYDIPEDYEGIGFVITGYAAKEAPAAAARKSLVRIVQ